MIKFTVHKQKKSLFNTVQSHKGHMHCCSASSFNCSLDWHINGFLLNPTKLHSHGLNGL